jgi:serine/threonine protein kinase
VRDRLTRSLGRLIGPYRVERAPDDSGAGARYEAVDVGTGKRVTVVVHPDAERAPPPVEGSAAEGGDHRLGQVLGDTYRLVERLGVGGMGIVYRGWDVRLRRPVAIKLLTEASTFDAQTRERFASEARVLASLGHPNVVRVYDVGSEAGLDFFAMELLPGPSLADWIAEQAPDAAAWQAALATPVDGLRGRVRWIRDAARAIHEAHRAGIVHRDLKPANLMLDASGQVRVLDFGLAHVSGEEKTRTQARLGTPRFMAPEQIEDPKRVDQRADVYSLGLTLHALLALLKPFADVEDEHQILAKAAKGDLPPIRRINPLVPDDLATVLGKAIEVRPADRYPNAAAFADDLDAWLNDRPVAARPASLIERGRKFVRREPVITLGFLVLLLSLVLVATVARTARSQAEAQASRLALRHIHAVEEGDPAGMVEFGRHLEQLSLRQEARRYYLRAAEADHPEGMFLLGRLLHQDPDPAERAAARSWLQQAAERGHRGAAALLKSLGPR